MYGSAEEELLSHDLSWVPARGYYENLAESALLTIWRRRGLLIAALAISVALAGFALLLLKKEYTAETIVKLDLARREAILAREAVLANEQAPAVMLDGASIVQGEAKTIHSRLMARRVIRKLSLDASTAHAPSAFSAQNLLAGVLTSAQLFLKEIGFDAGLLNGSQASAEIDGDRVIRSVMSHLAVETDSRSYLITIRYASNDPNEAARIANAFAEEYLLRHSELSSRFASHVTEWYLDQIGIAKSAQQAAEAAIDAFRQRTGLLDVGPNGENVQQQQLRDLNDQLSAASLGRLNEENRLNRVRRIIAAGGTPSAGDLQGIPLIQTLATNEAAARKELSELTTAHGPSYPEVVRARAALSELQGSLRGAIGRTVSILEADVSAATRAEQDLKNRLEVLQHTVVNSKVHEAELHDLQANVQTAQERVTSLTSQL